MGEKLREILTKVAFGANFVRLLVRKDSLQALEEWSGWAVICLNQVSRGGREGQRGHGSKAGHGEGRRNPLGAHPCRVVRVRRKSKMRAATHVGPGTYELPQADV